MSKDIINTDVTNVVQDGMMEFSAYVLLNRAIPDLRDGLKPVYRRILYTMYKMKATSFTKGANVSGQVMKLHPHGDSYGTAIGMVQKDRHITPFIEGKGNFGSYTSRDLAPAASRYSEIRLSPISIDMMKNFDKKIVPFIDNYDGTLKMPEVLPVKFPTILTFAQSGIGVGFSSSTMSFNLSEVCDAFISYLKDGSKTYLVPDFATYGSIEFDKEVIRSINEDGRGTVRIRGKAEIEKNKIIITEIPYETTREAIIDKVVALNKSGRLKEVSDIKDLTGLKGQKITVTAKRGTNMEQLLEKLYRYTPLESTYSANMNIIVDGLPRVLGVWPIIEKWLTWRQEVIRNEIRYDIGKISERLQILYGLKRILVDIDRAIEIIRRSPEDQIEINLMKTFDVDETQADYISNMKLRNINDAYIEKQIQSIKELEDLKLEKEEIVKDVNKINDIIVTDLSETKKKFGKERRTKVVRQFAHAEIVQEKEEKVIEKYPVKIVTTKNGYIYKFSKLDEDPMLVPNDSIDQVFMAENTETINLISKDNYNYKILLNDLPITKSGEIGTYLSNFLSNDGFEYISSFIVEDAKRSVVFIYESGRATHVAEKVYQGSIKRVKYAYHQSSIPVFVKALSEDIELEITFESGKKQVVNTKDLTIQKSRNASGRMLRKEKVVKVEERA